MSVTNISDDYMVSSLDCVASWFTSTDTLTFYFHAWGSYGWVADMDSDQSDFIFLLYQSKWKGKRNLHYGETGVSWKQYQGHHCHFAKALLHSCLCSIPCHLASAKQGKLEKKQRPAVWPLSKEKCRDGSAPGTILLLTSKLDVE